MDTTTEDLHGRKVLDSTLIGALPHSVTGTEDIAVWRVEYGFDGVTRCAWRYVLNGSPWLSLSELLRAFDDNPTKRDRILTASETAIGDWWASRDDSARLDY
jgi:hypothetical protein